MILECPDCEARYAVPAAAFASGPRLVRCARCGYDWLADSPAHVTAVEVRPEPPPPDPVPGAEDHPADEAGPDRGTGQAHEPAAAPPPVVNLPAIRTESSGTVVKLALVISLLSLIVLIGLALGKFGPGSGQNGRRAGAAAPNQIAYNIDDGLVLQDIHIDKKPEDGRLKLVIIGNIRNDGPGSQPVPDLLATLIGPDQQVIQSWRIAGPAATLPAGGVMPFQSAIAGTAVTGATINLSFAGKPHDDK